MTSSTSPITPNFTQAVLDLTCEIQSIPAPTFHETRRAVFFLEKLNSLGLADVHQDAAGNVLARLPGKAPASQQSSGGTRPLVVSAHMDTVHPFDIPLDIKRLPDRIIGPGIGDNALGAASVIGIVQKLKEDAVGLPGDLWVVLNVAEEGLGDLRGIKAVVDRFNEQPLAYLVVEGLGLGTVLNRGLGVERYKISISTPGGHSWVDYGQPSAIHELCRLVTALTDLHVPQNPCSTLNVGVIQGGTSINTIAANAWLELDLRSEDGPTLARMVNGVHKICRQAEHPRVAVKIERIGKRLAGKLASDHPLPVLAQEILNELNLEARFDIASTDANLPLSRGYPAICIGITHGNHAHTLEEYILTEPVRLGLAQLYHLVTRAWERIQ